MLYTTGYEREHERALGNPKPSRDLYRSGQQEEGERRYLAHLRNGAAAAVDALAAKLGEEPTCVLCFEHDHRACHRNLIVAELRERLPSMQVFHI